MHCAVSSSQRSSSNPAPLEQPDFRLYCAGEHTILVLVLHYAPITNRLTKPTSSTAFWLHFLLDSCCFSFWCVVRVSSSSDRHRHRCRFQVLRCRHHHDHCRQLSRILGHASICGWELFDSFICCVSWLTGQPANNSNSQQSVRSIQAEYHCHRNACLLDECSRDELHFKMSVSMNSLTVCVSTFAQCTQL